MPAFTTLTCASARKGLRRWRTGGRAARAGVGVGRGVGVDWGSSLTAADSVFSTFFSFYVGACDAGVIVDDYGPRSEIWSATSCSCSC